MSLWLLAAWLAAPGLAGESKGPTPGQALAEAYDQAFKLYQAGNYRRAILKWDTILRSDPNQITAKKMIEQARVAIAAMTKKRRAKVASLIEDGQYQAAALQMQELLDLDPSDSRVHAAHSRLEDVSRIVREAPKTTKAWRVAARGLRGFVGFAQDLRMAHNGLRYASELDPDEDAFPKLLALLRATHPQLGEDEVTPGMKLMEYKHLVALHHIYDARYHAAVSVLNEILQLEPDDITALKRLGSAYFSLGRKPQARDAWTRALQLSPSDSSLKEHLAKVK